VEFINETKETYLNFKGEFKDTETGFDNDIDIHLRIDTLIYQKYDWTINDGILTVALKEIVNVRPEFDQERGLL